MPTALVAIADGSEDIETVTLIDVLYLFPLERWKPFLVRCRQTLNRGGVLLLKEMEHRPRWKFLKMRLQEGLIKEWTGGEPILVRALHSDFIVVLPKFKLTMSGNHKPDIRGTDDGIWRRFLMVPFTEQIPVAERDPHLVDKLWEERDGIFQWLIVGLNQFQEIGLSPPEILAQDEELGFLLLEDLGDDLFARGEAVEAAIKRDKELGA